MELKKIELSENEKQYMKTFVEKDKNAQAGFKAASRLVRIAQENLWIALEKLYPDAMGKTTTFNHEEGFLEYIEK